MIARPDARRAPAPREGRPATPTPHRRLLGATLLALAACNPGGSGDDPRQPLSPAAALPQTRPLAGTKAPSPSARPHEKQLRAAHIAAVQSAASEAYAARATSAGQVSMDNPAQRFAATLDATGLQVEPAAGGYRLSMQAVATGCEGAMTPLPRAAPEATGKLVRYARGDVTESYLNGPLGIEQTFVLARAPECRGPKVIRVHVAGDLSASPGAEDSDGHTDSAHLVDATGTPVLSYTDLFVTDANGAVVPAWLSVTSGEIAIVVDDSAARYPLTVDPIVATQTAKLVPADNQDGDRLGSAVALDGDTALIAAPWDADKGTYSGSVYVYVYSAGAWTQQAKLLAPDEEPGDFFGHAVAIDGDTAIVGSYHDDKNGPYSGSAYVFVRSGSAWTLQAKLLAADGMEEDEFGSSVALQGDTALIGAQGDDSDMEIDTGSAYVFVRTAGVWTQRAKITPNDAAAEDYFGSSVALSGSTALVGALFDVENGVKSGSVYVLVGGDATWSVQTKLVPTNATGLDLFGGSAELEGDTALIGASLHDGVGAKSGAAYVFRRNGAVWTQEAFLLPADNAADDHFGNSVSLSGDLALVGSIFGDGAQPVAGAAYVFQRNGASWTQQSKFFASDGQVIDYFASAVALRGGTTLLGAAHDGDGGSQSGSAYVFRLGDPAALGAPCGTSVDCLSGFCADGVCCDSACGGGALDCQACSIAAGAPSDGTCAVAAAGTICHPASQECDVDETCNGVDTTCPADMVAPDGQPCSNGLCEGGLCPVPGGVGGSGGSGSGAGGSGGSPAGGSGGTTTGTGGSPAGGSGGTGATGGSGQGASDQGGSAQGGSDQGGSDQGGSAGSGGAPASSGDCGCHTAGSSSAPASAPLWLLGVALLMRRHRARSPRKSR